MKLVTEYEEIKTFGASEEKSIAFRLKNSAKAFSVLSSKLYTDKILAVIRELSCNAYDSHVAVGKPQAPFDVHLPTALAPELRIRDYGTGLDHDEVVNVYTVYFESTKQDSNDFIGALGLGSKSPFSYTTNFVITAYKGGVQRIYIARLKNGEPDLVPISEEETDEPDGVLIQIAVQTADMARFAEAAQKTFMWFSTHPTFQGNVIQINPPRYKHENIVPGVHIRDNSCTHWYGSQTPLAKQGNVVYPLAPNPHDIDEDLRFLLRFPFVIDFPMGSLDVAASREELSYVDWTIANINQRLREILPGIRAYVDSEVAKATTGWTKLYALYKLATSNLFAKMADEKAKSPSFNPGIQYVWDGSYKQAFVTEKDLKANGVEIVAYDVETKRYGNGLRIRRQAVKTTNPSVMKDENVYVHLHDPAQTRFYVNDTGKPNAIRQMRHSLEHERDFRSNATIYMIAPINPKATLTARNKAINAAIKLLGDVEVIRCSNIQLPPRVPKTAQHQKISIVLYKRDAFGKFERNYTEDTLQNISGGKELLYVPLKNLVIENATGDMKQGAFYSFLDDIIEAGIITRTTQIVGVRRASIKNLTPNCVNLFTYVRDHINKIPPAAIANDTKREQFMTLSTLTLDSWKKVAAQMPVGHHIRTMVDGMVAHTATNKASVLAKISIKIGMEDVWKKKCGQAADTGVRLWADIRKRYPLLEHIDMGYRNNAFNGAVFDRTVEYIKLMDSLLAVDVAA